MFLNISKEIKEEAQETWKLWRKQNKFKNNLKKSLLLLYKIKNKTLQRWSNNGRNNTRRFILSFKETKQGQIEINLLGILSKKDPEADHLFNKWIY